MALLDELFDSRLSDEGQRDALDQHDHKLSSIDRDLDEIAAALREGDERLHRRVSKLKKHFDILYRRVNRLELVTEALFAHMEANGEITKQTLRARMGAIDVSDGKRDGRARNRRT